MSEPFLGELLFSGFSQFVPNGYADCNGAMLSIAQNSALFALLGTFYGGDGRATFALPDLRGRTPTGGFAANSDPGRATFPIGTRTGSETVTLTSSQLPTHTHALSAVSAAGSSPGPTAATFAAAGNAIYAGAPADSSLVPLTGSSSNSTGGNQPHSNMQPFLVIPIAIAIQGVFPSRS